MRYGSTVKPPVQLMSTVNGSSVRSVGAPMTVLLMVSVSVSRSLTKAALMMPVESVVTLTVVPLVLVHPVGGVCSVTEHSVPGGSSGVSGVAQVPDWLEVVMVCVPENSTPPAPSTHSTSNKNVASRSTGVVVGPVVVLVIERVDVVLVISIVSPSSSITTSALTVLVKRGSGSSTAEHSAPVGRLSTMSGVLAVTTKSLRMCGSTVNPPPVQVTVTVNSSFIRSTSAGTPSRVFVTVNEPASRSFEKLAVVRPASMVIVCGLGEVTVQPAGTVSVMVQSIPGVNVGRSK